MRYLIINGINTLTTLKIIEGDEFLYIKEINESDFKPFFKLMAEVECGNHFDFSSPKHISWLNNKISTYYFRGAKFFGSYSDDSTLIGFITVLIERGLEGVKCIGQKAEILDVGVFLEFRGKSYGSKLLQYVERYCKQEGVYCLYVSTSVSSYKVIAFYGKNEFMPVATLPNIYGHNDEGNLFMRKIL